jgi:DHA1 family purine ribonucleoside efflux pump-like MFS transporter
MPTARLKSDISRMGVSVAALQRLAVCGYQGFRRLSLARASMPATARSPSVCVALGAVFIAIIALALFAFGTSAALSSVAVALWGFAFGCLPVGFQTWVVRAAPDQPESAGGLLVTAFQVAITGGAVFGGLLVDGFGPLGAIAYAGLATLLGAVITLVFAPKEVL